MTYVLGERVIQREEAECTHYQYVIFLRSYFPTPLGYFHHLRTTSSRMCMNIQLYICIRRIFEPLANLPTHLPLVNQSWLDSNRFIRKPLTPQSSVAEVVCKFKDGSHTHVLGKIYRIYTIVICIQLNKVRWFIRYCTYVSRFYFSQNKRHRHYAIITS